MFVQIVSFNSKRVSVSPGKVIKVRQCNFITTVISHPEADEVLTHARFSYQYSLRERFRTHKVFTKDQCFYLNNHKFSIRSYVWMCIRIASVRRF